MLKIACHTLTWGNFYKDYDIRKTLAEIKLAGYDGVECYEPLSMLGSVDEFKELLKENGLSLVSLSCNLNLNPNDEKDINELKQKADFAANFGVKTLMVCGGCLENPREKKDEDFQILASKLKDAITYAKKLKMEIAFHPHLGTIVESADDIEKIMSLVRGLKLCIDIAHLAAAGCDPLSVSKDFREIIALVHLKDFSRRKRQFVELGRGDVGLNIRAVMEELKDIGYKGWQVVELDATTTTPLESAKANREYLRQIGY